VLGRVAGGGGKLEIHPEIGEGRSSRSRALVERQRRHDRRAGIGRQNGLEGFEQYLETKTIALPAR